MNKKYKEIRARLLEQRKTLKSQADEILLSEREFTDEDQKSLDEMNAKLDAINAKLDAMAAMGDDEEDRDDEDGEEVKDEGENSFRNAPAFHRSRGRVSAANVHEHAKKEGFSLSRAANSYLKRGRLDGIEAEVDQELRRESGYCNGSFKIPCDFRRLNQKMQVRSDLTLTTGTGAVPTYWDGADFIEYLYPKLVGPQLGITYMSGLAATTKLPRQSGVPTVSAVAEQGSASGSAPSLDNVTLTPHTLSANVTISRKFLMQSIVAADQYVNQAGSRQIAVQMDAWVFSGSGSSNIPAGILNNSAVTQIQVAASNAVAYSDTLALEKFVAKSNANFGSLAYLTSPAGYAKLRQTPQLGSTFPVFIVDNDGRINGKPCIQSSQISDSLSYTGTSGLTALIYGSWEFCVQAVFGSGLDVIVDMYTGSTSGDVTITFLMDTDTNVLQGGAFAYCPNVGE